MSVKSQGTIRRILKAATTSFAGHGYEGARMDEIATRADVNKATIYYHIGDKKALYAAVLHDVFDEQVEKITLQLRTVNTPERKLKVLIRNMHRLIDERPHIPSIIMREVASGGKHFPEILIQDLERIIELMGDVLEQGRSEGSFTAANPLVVHLMALAPMAYYKKLGSVLQNHNLCDDACRHRTGLSFAKFAAEIERLVLKSLLPTDSDKKGPKS